MAKTIQTKIIEDLKLLGSQNIDKVIEDRIEKFCAMGVVVEA
jgi:acetyl-CoA carboxylase carboxyl transferase subunit alpha